MHIFFFFILEYIPEEIQVRFKNCLLDLKYRNISTISPFFAQPFAKTPSVKVIVIGPYLQKQFDQIFLLVHFTKCTDVDKNKKWRVHLICFALLSDKNVISPVLITSRLSLSNSPLILFKAGLPTIRHFLFFIPKLPDPTITVPKPLNGPRLGFLPFGN